MKGLFRILAISFLFVFNNCTGQENNIYQQITNKKFITFIDKFYTIDKFPFNRRKNEQYLVENKLYKGPGITRQEAKTFLKKSEKDLMINVEAYNENGKLVVLNTTEKKIYKAQKMILNNFILIITEESPDKQTFEGESDRDTLMYFLRIINVKADIVDSMIVGGYNNLAKDYKDIVFTKNNQFRIFSYTCNENNFKGGYVIDKISPLTFLNVTDFEIDDNTGKIKRIEETVKDFSLFNLVEKYRFNGIKDDPLNNY